MKKLAILAAAAIGYALANRVGRKQDLGFSGPVPTRPDYAPAGTDPFTANAPGVPLRVVEDLPEEPVADEAAPELVTDAPLLDEPFTAEPVEDEANTEVEETDSALSDDVSEEPVVEEVFAPVDADPHALSDAAAEVDETIEAELTAEPAIAPVIEDVIPSTPVAETQEQPDVPSPDLSSPEVTESSETSPELEQVSAPPVVDESPAVSESETETETEAPASSWDESWVDDMPAPQEAPEAPEQTSADELSPEASAEAAETIPERKLSEIAEGINERIRTAADLAREEEPVVEDSADVDDVESVSDEEPQPETFVVPTAEDFADEVFEDEVAPESTASADLGDTALMDAIPDEDVEKS